MTASEHNAVGRQIRQMINREPDAWGLATTGVSLKGTPDWLLCVDGVFVALEVKTGNADATAIQAQRIVEILSAGGIARIVHTPDEARQAVQDARQLAKRRRSVS